MPAPVERNLDDPTFDAAEVARIAGIQDVKTVANWTDRGLVDPYHGSWEWKRGRGRARQYSLRDILTFVLMRDLSDRYEIPIPLGRRICGVVFTEPFTPAKVGYIVVGGVRADRVRIDFFRTPRELARHLGSVPTKSRLVLDTAITFSAAQAEAQKVLSAREARQE
jgi:hypothetical protein